MEIIRFLNGVEISREELYSRKMVTEEMMAVVNEVRRRVYSDNDETSATDAEE